MPEPGPCQDAIYDYYRIPDGSTAELWLEGTAGDFVAKVIVRDAAGAKEVPHSKIFRQAGTSTSLKVKLAKPKLYFITLLTGFTKTSTMRVRFHIVTPPGSPGPEQHSTPVDCTVRRQRNKVDERIFFVKTLQS